MHQLQQQQMQTHHNLNPQLKKYNSKSPTLQINERSIALQKQGRKIYRFGLGQSPFPVPQSVVEQLKRNSHQKDYLSTIGLKKLRQSVSEWFKRDGLQFSCQNILIGPGSKQLLFIAGLVLDSQLIVNSPCWVSYIPQARFLNKNIIYIENTYENRWRLTPEDLDKAAEENKNEKKKIIILTYPDNPTGLTYSSQQLKNIAEVARKHQIIVISDEIYGKVNYEGQHDSIAKYYPEGTIISTGLSKWAGAGGWRLGLFAFPQSLSWMKNAMVNVASETYSAVSAPVQYAAITAFDESPDIKEYLSYENQILKSLAKWVYNHLVTNTQLRTYEPEGAFYIFLDLQQYSDKLKAKNINASLQLSQAILQDIGVAILPGSAFGRNPAEYTLRLSFVNFDGAAALNCLQTANKDGKKIIVDEDFLRKYCPDTLEGIQKLTEWIQKL